MIFDDEFDELAALAYQTAFRVLGSRSEAQEVAQDTMIKAYLRWRKGATPCLLASLSGRQRDVVTLRYLADTSEADVADELGISVGTVKTHASRGVETLRHHLAGTPADEPSESDLDDRKEHTDV